MSVQTEVPEVKLGEITERVVLAASCEARAFGIRGGMPGRQARELCPQRLLVDHSVIRSLRRRDAAHSRARTARRRRVPEAFECRFAHVVRRAQDKRLFTQKDS